MRKIIYFMYHRTDQIDYDWLNTCLKSLKRVCTADIVVVTDNMPTLERDLIKSKFKVKIIKINSSEWEGRRTLCRLEQTNKIIQSLKTGKTLLIQSDIDVLFLDNPFKAFEEKAFNIGVTVRMYNYHVPVNSGLVFFKIDDNVKEYATWAVEQVKSPTWWPYMTSRSSRDNLDWGCDQDMYNAIWIHNGLVCSMFNEKDIGLMIKDVGYEYNYCAGTDVLGFEPAAHLMRRALETKDYHVLHFKGQYLKKMIYESCMENYR